MKITDFNEYKLRLDDVLNNVKFIEEEENYIKKLAKPKTEKEKKADEAKKLEREAKKKAYLEKKALQLEQTKKKAEEDRMFIYRDKFINI